MYKNKNFITAFFVFFFLVGTLLFAFDVNAAGLQYTLLEKIPGFNSIDGSDFPGYITAVYNVALAVVVLSAVLMVSVGGFMYLTSGGNTSTMGTAKGVIFDALIGLVLALFAWVLLNTINPDLTNVSINGLSAIPVPGSSAPSAKPSTIPPGGTWPDDKSIRDDLKKNFNIEVNLKNCQNQGDTGCTSLAGSAAIDAVKALGVACGNSCAIVITGGTECWLHGGAAGCAGGTHHIAGDFALDLKHGAVDTYITTNGTKICEIKGRPVYKIGNAIYWDEDIAHWHANFNKSNCTSI